jgi:histidine triad (HIT) family protein
MYQKTNIFYQIINKKIPCKTIYEDENILCFYDINPKAKTHALAIPKKEFIDFCDFATNSTNEEVASFFKQVNYIATNILGLKNFKMLTNNGGGAGQEVFHFHVHILSNDAIL